MKNMLFIIKNLSGFGGQSRSLTYLCNELMKKNGYNITIVSCNGRDVYYELDNRIITHFMQKPSTKMKKTRMSQFAHLIKGFLFVAKLIRKPNDYHLLVGYGDTTAIIVGILKRFTKIPIVYCERGNPKSRAKWFPRRLFNSIGRYAVRKTNAVFQSKAVSDCFRNMKLTTIVPNLIGTEVLPIVNNYPDRACKVLGVGRYVSGKNFALLIKSFVGAHNEHSEYVLEIYGDGNQKKELEELIKQYNAESFIKLVPTVKDVFNVMNNNRMFICSSIRNSGEGYPNALLEAMAMGMACISTDCCGAIRDMIEDGVNGIVIPADDEHAMTKALIKLMENETLAGKMAKNATTVRESNAKERITDEWALFFDRVMADTL